MEVYVVVVEEDIGVVIVGVGMLFLPLCGFYGI